MQKITNRKKLFLYGCSGMGVNMLNLIMGSYLLSALIAGGFVENVESWTYISKDLVIAGIWSVLVFAIKAFDGIIDVPLASFTDRLKTRFGRRRPSILIGFIPMIIAYVLFLFPIHQGKSLANTIWFAALLGIFYCFYTLTMLTYYATFSEVCETEQDIVFLSNTKSVFDVVYFIFGYALLPVFISIGINIRYVALIFLPLAFLMLIPLFMLKEKSTKAEIGDNGEMIVPESDALTLGKAIKNSFQNKKFIYWMFTAAVMNFGLQLFLSGINELFSSTGLNMTVVMASSFAPVPLTLLLYNKIVKKFGLGHAYRYILTIFSMGMIIMFICTQTYQYLTDLQLTLIAVFGGILVSFAIGAFFSVTYTVPTHLASEQKAEKGVSVASMYFAVQGLFEGLSAGLATGIVLVNLKDHRIIHVLPLIVAGACMVAFIMSLMFPKNIAKMGKDSPAPIADPDKTDDVTPEICAAAEVRFTDEQIKDKLRELFADNIGIGQDEITDDGHFMNDLGGSSLDYYEVIVEAEEFFGVKLEFETEDFSYSLNDLAKEVKDCLSK